MKVANEIKKKEEHLQKIEDDIAIVMLLQKRKRLQLPTQQSQSRKRGKYVKNTLYFTDPTTGKRSVMSGGKLT